MRLNSLSKSYFIIGTIAAIAGIFFHWFWFIFSFTFYVLAWAVNYED